MAADLPYIEENVSGGEQAEGRAKFLYQDGLLYRKWSPDSSSDVNACEQLVLPKQYRPAFLQIAHDVLAAGHMGIDQTRRRNPPQVLVARGIQRCG